MKALYVKLRGMRGEKTNIIACSMVNVGHNISTHHSMSCPALVTHRAIGREAIAHSHRRRDRVANPADVILPLMSRCLRAYMYALAGIRTFTVRSHSPTHQSR